MKRSPLKRTTGLSARGKGGACPPKPSGAERNGIGTPKRKSKAVPQAGWTEAVFERHGHVCRVCGALATDAHHLVPQQVLRRELAGRCSPAELRSLLGDPDNGLPLCRVDHMRHEFSPGFSLAARHLDPEAVDDFLARVFVTTGVDLSWCLDRYDGLQDKRWPGVALTTRAVTHGEVAP